jgi:hypothetical protein
MKRSKLFYLIFTVFLFSQLHAQEVEVLGKVKITDGTEGAGKVLVSDADGLASWSSPGLSIGDTHAGGIIFYLDGSRKHGLVAKATDEPGEIKWAIDDSSTVGSFADGPHGGAFNQRVILERHPGGMAPAAQACEDINIGPNVYSDWYLPSRYELFLMYQNIGPGASAPNTNIGNFLPAQYWTSTEYQESGRKCCAHMIHFGSGTTNFNTDQTKDDSRMVRAVRAF